MLYVLALKNSTWHCVASYPSYLCCIREWVNLVMISAWHLVLWAILLYQQRYIVSLSSDKCTFCKSLWIKASDKYLKCKNVWFDMCFKTCYFVQSNCTARWVHWLISAEESEESFSWFRENPAYRFLLVSLFLGNQPPRWHPRTHPRGCFHMINDFKDMLRWAREIRGREGGMVYF